MSKRIHGVEVYEALDKLVNVDVDLGSVTWAVKVRKGVQIGQEAGSYRSKQNTKIYRYIGCTHNGKKCYVKRSNFIWWKKHGKLPDGIIDHFDQESTNDAVSNLIEVTDQENSMNRKKIAGKELPTGVSKSKNGKKYRARVGFNKKSMHLGTYATVEEAYAAVKQKRKELGFHDNHGS